MPQTLVHRALDTSISDFGSPSSEASSSDSSAFTSSLQYINAQLVAHGFTPSPGLSCEGLSKSDTDILAKCLLAMLSQRVVRCSCMIAQVMPASLRFFRIIRMICLAQKIYRPNYELSHMTTNGLLGCIAQPLRWQLMQSVK